MNSTESSTPPLAPPSRASNPFATCWTCPGAIPFQFPRGESAEQLVSRLAEQNWWGEIVGPHGAGKSTLLESLKPLIVAAGQRVLAISLHDRQRRLPSELLRQVRAQSQMLVIVDGYEQLSRFRRLTLRWRCRSTQVGLLITSHSRTGLPLLTQLNPDRAVVDSLVATLTAERPSRITPADIDASHAVHGSNVRELLFDLHDRHESARRSNRQATATVTNTATAPIRLSAADKCLRC